MAVGASEESLELLADVASSFCTRDPARVRAVRDSDAPFDREMWGRLAENGWLEILVPERLGGAGLGLEAATLITRRLGRGAFPEPFVAAGVLAPVVLAAAAGTGADADSEARLVELLQGELIAGVAWHGDVAAGDQGHLNGESRFTGVGGADGYVVAANGPDGTELFWLEAGTPGLAVRNERQADGSISAALTLTGAPGARLAGGGDVVEDALDVARVALAAELLGIADAALELTLAYLLQRKQFDRAIGSFQALQHRAVDMWMARELANAAVEAAVAVYADPDSSPRERAIAASSAKARAAMTAPYVCNEALQLHGAIGFTDEYDLGLYLNRALALAPWLGNAREHRRRYIELTLDRSGAA